MINVSSIQTRVYENRGFLNFHYDEMLQGNHLVVTVVFNANVIHETATNGRS